MLHIPSQPCEQRDQWERHIRSNTTRALVPAGLDRRGEGLCVTCEDGRGRCQVRRYVRLVLRYSTNTHFARLLGDVT